MAPRRVKINKFDYTKISANDVICPICRSVIIRPITLPCSHGFCLACFEATSQNANVVCPLCMVRVGSWLRSATKSNKLINEALWKAIQDTFPTQVKNKLNGRSENILEEITAENLVKNVKSERFTDKKPASIKLENEESLPSTSTDLKSREEVDEERKEKAALFLNNFATKEYTCRILCQDVGKKAKNESRNLVRRNKRTQKNIKSELSNDSNSVKSESQNLVKKPKRIKKITKSEFSDDRSDSIESECLYFKPIDHKLNPRSEGLAPIKVPTRKPNITADVNIVAPCGQNQINLNSPESAFARLYSPQVIEPSIKQENDQSEMSSHQESPKRKLEKPENKSRKKIKSKESLRIEVKTVCDRVDNFNISISNNNLKKNNLKSAKHLVTEENLKKSLQEQADFELATKLQQTYNQSSKYSTRSTVLKRMAASNQVIEGIMTPYKVK